MFSRNEAPGPEKGSEGTRPRGRRLGVWVSLLALLAVGSLYFAQQPKPHSAPIARRGSQNANVGGDVPPNPSPTSVTPAVSPVTSAGKRVTNSRVTVWVGPRTKGMAYSGRMQAPPPTEPLDVAFVVDTSYGMANALLNLKTELSDTLNDIEAASGGNYRLALVSFTGQPGANATPVVAVQAPFATGNRTAFLTALQTLQASATPSSSAWGSQEALDTVINNIAQKPTQTGTWPSGFRGNARRVIVTVTDSPTLPGSYVNGSYPGILSGPCVPDAMLRLASDAANQDIMCHTVAVTPEYYDDQLMEVYVASGWRAFANLTRGTYKLGADGYSTQVAAKVRESISEATEQSGFRVGIGGPYIASVRFPFPTSYVSGPREKRMTVALTSFGGYSGPVTLETQGGPSGAVVTLSATSITLTSNQTTNVLLTIREPNSNIFPTGVHQMTVRATAPGKSSSAVVKFDVDQGQMKGFLFFYVFEKENPWRNNGGIPAAVRVTPGSQVHPSVPPSALYTYLGNSDTAARMDMHYIPVGATGNLFFGDPYYLNNPDPLTTLAGFPTGISPITPMLADDLISLNVANTVRPGLYPIRIRYPGRIDGRQVNAGFGTRPGYSRESYGILWFLVPKPRLSLTVNPETVSVNGGASGTATASVSARSGVGGNATLGLRAPPPAGISVTFNPMAVTVPNSGAAATSTISVSVAAGTAPGDYPLEVIAVTPEGAEGSTPLTVRVPTTPTSGNFTLSANPATRSVLRGSSGTYTITATPTGPPFGNVPLTISGLPAGVTAAFSPASISMSGSPGSSTLTLTVGTGATPGTYSPVVSGTLSGNTRTVTLTLVIPAPAFDLTVAPASVSATAGGSASSPVTVTVNPLNGFTGAVTLQVIGLPGNANVTPTLTPNPTTGAATLTFTASSTAPGKSYLLTVRGTSGALVAERNLTLKVVVSPPAAPTSLQATAAGPRLVNLTWTDASSNEEGFRIERRQSVGSGEWSPWAVCGQVGAGVTAYADDTAQPATTYEYRVFAFNTGGDSGSNTASVTTPADDLADGPTGLIATAKGHDRILLEWSDNSARETGFYIERRLLPTDPWNVVGAANQDAQEYLDKNLTPDTQYEYRVCAYNSGGNSPYTNIARARTFLAPVGNLGTDFWIAFPTSPTRAQNWGTPVTETYPNKPSVSHPNECFVTITSVDGATGTVAVPGLSFSQAFTVLAGGNTRVTLPAGVITGAEDGIANKAVRVTSSGLVSVTGTVHTFGNTEAFAALPVTAAGTEHVILDYYNYSAYLYYALGSASAFFTVVATQDNTKVTITPSANAGAAGAPRSARVPYTVTLNQGQVYQLQAVRWGSNLGQEYQLYPNENDSLTGSVVQSDKPVSVITGNQGVAVPSGFTGPGWHGENGELTDGASLLEQLPPVNRWATEYLSLPLTVERSGSEYWYPVANRSQTLSAYRVVAAQDGTWVRANGVLLATLNRGEYYTYQADDGRPLVYAQENHTRVPIRFTSNNPILVAQYGFTQDSQATIVGSFGNPIIEPFMSLLPAVDQGASRFLVMPPTPTVNQDYNSSGAPGPLFTQHYLTVMGSQSVLSLVQLDGVALPLTNQVPIGVGPEYGVTLRVSGSAHSLLTTDNSRFHVQIYGISEDGQDAYGHLAGVTLPQRPAPDLNAPPSVRFTAPINDALFTGSGVVPVPVTVNAQDTDGSVVSVEYQLFKGDTPLIDKNLVDTQIGTAAPFSANFAVAWGAGYYRVRAIAFDNKGGASSAWTRFRVFDPNANVAPEVTLVNPNVPDTRPGASYGPPAPVAVPVTANVTDADGNLSSVAFELRQGVTVVQSVTPTAAGSLFTGTFTNVAAGAYTLTARGTDTKGLVGTKDLAVFVVDRNGPPTRINCGGPQYTDSQSRVWAADMSYAGGETFNFNLGTITGTTDPALYNDVRRSVSGSFTFRYTFYTTPNGKAKVKLHYVEGQATAAGQRTFDVTVNGVPLQSGGASGRDNYDIFVAAGGAGKAVVDTLDVTADADGFVTLDFSANSFYGGYQAVVSAIEFVPDVSKLTCDSSLANGQLDTGDDAMTLPGTAGTFRADRYTLDAKNGQNLSLSLSKQGGNFTPYLYLLAPEGNVVAQGTAGATLSTLTHTATREGTYTVVATSAPTAPDTTGGYSLSLNCAMSNVTPPAAPTNLVAKAVSDPKELKFTEIELTWRDASTDETGFEVWRKDTPTSTAVRVAQLASNVTGQIVWREPNPFPSEERVLTYYVTAVKNSVSSGQSNDAIANTYIVPPVVAVLSPLPGASVAAGAVTVEISASASAGRDITTGGVVLKDFGAAVSGATVVRDPLAEQNQNRYRITWPSAPAGDHRISVTVTDSGGVPTTSPDQRLNVGGFTVTAPTIANVGTFNNGPVIVGIATMTPEATLYYTVDYTSVAGDGGAPDPGAANTRKYTGPFILYRSGTVRARAYRDRTASADTTQAFSFNTTTVANPGTNYGVLNRQPDAYYNTFSTTIPSRITGSVGPGVEILTRDARIWGGVAGRAVASWSLSYRSLEADSRAVTEAESGWTPLSSGVGATGIAPLADFDTTLLANGQYELRLRVFNLNFDPANPNNPANYADTFRTVVVAGGQKVGPMNLSLVDLTLPSPGFPIQITRSYDSTDKTKGDFGVGWRLGVSNVRVQNSTSASDGTGGRSRRLGDGWQQFYSPLLNQYYLAEAEPHFLSIALPGGAVYAFYPKLADESSIYSFDQYNEIADPWTLSFAPVPGTQADQERPANASANSPGARLYAVRNGVAVQNIPFNVTLGSAAPGMPGVQRYSAQLLVGDDLSGTVLDIRQWLLVTRDGTRYYLDTDLGITKIVDRNDNEIVYAYEDAMGGKRVKTVTSYRNTSSGLVATRSVTVNRLNANSYVTSLSDGDGHNILYGQNADGDLASVTNRTGAVTQYQYDRLHNLTKILAPSVTQTGDAEFPTIQPTVTNVYDEAGRLTATVDAEGRVTRQGHDTDGRRAVITDPQGKQSLVAYDDVGNVRLTAAYVTEKDAQAVTKTRTVESRAEYGFWVAGDGSYQALNRFANLKTRQDVQISQDPNTGVRTLQVTKFGYDATFGDLVAVSDPRDATGTVIAQQMSYNGRGQVTEVRDPRVAQANQQTQQKNLYDDRGNLIETRDALNYRTIISDGNPTTTADNLNPDGSPNQVTDAQGNVTSFTYVTSGVNAGQVQGVNAPGGVTTAFTYKPTGEKASQAVTRAGHLNEDGSAATTQTLTTTFQYDNEGRLLKTIGPQNQANPNAVLARTDYNALGKVSQRTDGDGRVTKYVYDTRGLLRKTLSPDGVTSRTNYDASGRVVSTLAQSGQTSSTVYDALGRVYQSSSTDLNGQNPIITRSQYDDAGRTLKTFESRDNGATFPQKSDTTYDLAGNTLTSKDAAAIAGGLPATEYNYDAQGRNDWTKDARGNYTISEFDGLDRVRKTYFGGASATPTADLGWTETGYDSLGRKVWEKTREKSAAPTDVRIMAYRYDTAGRLDQVTQVMDVSSWLGSETDPLNKNLITRYGYDSAGNKTWQQDAEGVENQRVGSGPLRKTTFGYDDAGRMVWRKLPLGQIERMEYHPVNGRLVSTTDFLGKVTRYRYYGIAPVTGTAASQEQVAATDRRYGKLWYKQPDATLTEPGVTYDYYTDDDNQGRPWTATYGAIQTRYFYDERGRTRAVDTAFVDGSNRPTRTMRYRYDLAGNKISGGVELWLYGASVPFYAGATTHAYDASDRVQTVASKDWTPSGSYNADPGTWTGTATTIASYAYNANGSLWTVARPGGVNTRYEYNRRNELSWMTHTPPSGNLGSAQAFLYDADLSGRRTKMFDGAEVAIDGQGVPAPAANQPGTRYTYDKAGRLTQEERADGMTTVWAFDRVGNRKTQTVTKPGQSTQTTTYTYDENDRLSEESTVVGSTTTSRKVYQYNLNGQQTWSGEQTGAQLGTMGFTRSAQYAYTFEGRLRWVDNLPKTTTSPYVEFNYDAEGNRIATAKVTPNGANLSVDWNYQAIDTQQPYAEVAAEWSVTDTSANSGTTWTYGAWRLTARYDLGLDRLRAVRYTTNAGGTITGSATHGFLYDGLGSVRALTTGAGAKTDAYDYTAYGEVKALAGSAGTPNKFLFNGQQYDGSILGGASGLLGHVAGMESAYHLRARYYQPGNGRFISQDPNSGQDYEPGTLHRYRYAANDPINKVDPSGRADTLPGTLTSMSIGAIMTAANANLTNFAKTGQLLSLQDTLISAGIGAVGGLAVYRIQALKELLIRFLPVITAYAGLDAAKLMADVEYNGGSLEQKAATYLLLAQAVLFNPNLSQYIPLASSIQKIFSGMAARIEPNPTGAFSEIRKFAAVTKEQQKALWKFFWFAFPKWLLSPRRNWVVDPHWDRTSDAPKFGQYDSETNTIFAKGAFWSKEGGHLETWCEELYHFLQAKAGGYLGQPNPAVEAGEREAFAFFTKKLKIPRHVDYYGDNEPFVGQPRTFGFEP